MPSWMEELIRRFNASGRTAWVYGPEFQMRMDAEHADGKACDGKSGTCGILLVLDTLMRPGPVEGSWLN